MTKQIAAISISIALIVIMAACSGGVEPVGIQRASAYIGGALTNFSGFDADDPSARSVAREITVSRIFDLTPTGFILSSGAASSAAGGFGDFGSGTGTVTLGTGSRGSTIELNIDAINPRYSNITLLGRFNSLDAQQAIDSPGSSFTVYWDLVWEADATAFDLSAEQVVSGTDWN